jgi:hypothetical protein
LRNYAPDDQLRERPYTVPESLRRCYERASETFGWRTYQRLPADGPKRPSIGFAAHDWGGSGYPPAYAWVKLNGDGTADVITGTQDIGTGTRTALTQVAAEELGLPLEQVTLHLGDTAHGPYAPVSSGSATQATLGPAVRAAAADAKQQLLKAAAAVFETTPEHLRVRDGNVFLEGRADRGVAVKEVTKRIAPHMILGHGARGPNLQDKSVRTFGAQCVEVEVDLDTGEVTVLRVVAAHDCSLIINPTMVDSQVIGASRLVNIKCLTELPSGIADTPQGVTLGTLTTLAEVETHPLIKRRYPVLAQAAAVAATPQLRNMATLGGNLLQRPRCWYFWSRLLPRWLKGGATCPAHEGQNQLHALFGGGPCYAVHPSATPTGRAAWFCMVTDAGRMFGFQIETFSAARLSN